MRPFPRCLFPCTFCNGQCAVLTVVRIEPRFALCALCWLTSRGMR